MDRDRTLVMQAAAGDGEAFEKLVGLYRRSVYNLARTLCGDERDVEDLVQDTFVRAYRAIDRFRGDSAFSSWLYRIAVNVIQDHLGRRSRKESVLALGRDSTPALDEIVGVDDLELDVIRRQAIERALTSLPPDLRVLVVLRDVEGLKYEEIARILNLPRGTVDSRLHRARQRLRPMLAAFLPKPGGDARSAWAEKKTPCVEV